MATRRTQLDIRTKGGDQTKRDLKGVGDSGSRAFRRIRKSAEPANRGLVLLSRTSQRLQKSFRALASPRGLAALTATGGGLALLAQRALSAAESINDVSERTGVGVERLQELRFAFDQNGVSADQTDSALRRFNRRIGLAAEGTGAAANSVEKLGIQLQDADGNMRSTEAVLDDVIRAISNLESESERAAQASQFFGEDAGPAMAVLLGRGEDAINSYAERLRAMNGVMSEDTVQAGAKASAQIRSLGAVAKTAFQRGIIEGFTDELESFNDVVSDPDFQKSIAGFGSFIGGLISDAKDAAGAVADLASEVERLSGGILQPGELTAFPTIRRLLESVTGTPTESIPDDPSRPFGARPPIDPRVMGGSFPTSPTAVPPLPRLRPDLPGAGGGDGTEPPLPPKPGTKPGITPEVGPRSADDATARAESIEAQRQALEDLAATIRDSVMTPTERYAEELDRINRLQEAGIIDAETYRRAADGLADKFGDTETATARLGDAGKDLGFSFSSAFEGAIIEGERFSGVLQGLAQDIQRVALRRLVTEPLTGAVSNFVGGIDFGSFFTGGTAGGPAVPSSAGGLGQPLPTFARGGVSDGPSIFGEAGPEAAVPLPDGRRIPVDLRGGGAAVTNVIVENHGNERAEVQRSGNGRGGEDIRVILGREVGRQISSGVHDKPMRTRFGITPVTGAR